jgi:mannose-6-phosphate isomerase-like protein (cupin superfamily)
MIAPAIEQLQKKNFSKPDEVRTFEKGKVELITIGDVTFGKGTFQPGWKWSTCVKPIAQTHLCEAPHLQFQVSGRMHVVMEDGTEFETFAGDVVSIPPGHDAWVVGSEPVVAIDISGMREYAKRH